MTSSTIISVDKQVLGFCLDVDFFAKVKNKIDRDATRKAVDIVRHLSNYVPTKLVVLKKDLKNMEREERDDFINNYISR